MKFGKTIKRIVALGMGASMLGATILGASAASDLKGYPAPFVTNGKFSGYLVVGDNAAAEDVIGVSDIAMSLQYASSVNVGSGSGATTTVEGDAFRFSASGDELNLFQTLTSVASTLTDSDLKALADGQLKAKSTVDYSQTLTIPTTPAVTYTVDPDQDVQDPALYLKMAANQVPIDYKLIFTTQAESDVASGKLEDIEDQKITMLGKEYTITKAENSTTGTTAKLTLMSGAVQDTLEVGQSKTYTINGKDYEVSVLIVSGDVSSSAVTKLTVNGETTKSLSKDDTYTLKDGIDVGIKEILPTKSGDVVQNLVEFYLGAQKVVLDGANNKLQIGDETINDVATTVTVSTSGTVAKLSQIELAWTVSEDYYVPVGGKLSAAVASNTDYKMFLDKLGVDYAFDGLEASDSETLKFTPAGKYAYKIEFTNKKGVDYNQKVFYVGSNQGNPLADLGEDSTDPLRNREEEVICDNDYFILENDKNSRIMRFTELSVADQTITLKDVGTGDSSDYSWAVVGTNNASSVVLDGATYNLTINSVANKCIGLTNIAADTGDTQADLWTKYKNKIVLNNATNAPGFNVTITGFTDFSAPSNAGNMSAYILLTENSGGPEDDSTNIDRYAFNFSYSTSDGLDLSNVIFTNMSTATANSPLIQLDSDTDINEGYTPFGNFIKQNTNAQDKWEITIPKAEAVAKVYLTAGVTTISDSGAVSGNTVIVQKIEVGATKLASEVVGMETTANLILVGGPCANMAVEKASSAFPTCAAWPYKSGEALIQMVNQADGHVALLVAGSLAADTRTATRVVSEMTSLKALAAGVTKQKVTVGSSGKAVLNNVVEAAPVEAPADTTATQ